MMNFMLLDASGEISLESVSDLINVDIANGISNFVSDDIVMTIITTIIGIIAGAACSFKNRFWRNFTIILFATLFNVFMLLRTVFISEPWEILVFSLIIWTVLCFLAIKFLREKEIVSRKKIGKMIEAFTSTANPNKDVCIFAGDIDFFGEVIEKTDLENAESSRRKWSLITPIERIKERNKKRALEKIDIRNNSQFKQLNDPKFRSVCILCVKPLLQKGNIKDDYRKDRIRIGYIKEELGERVHFKFFNDDCDNCFFYEQNNCTLQKCAHKCSKSSKPSCGCPKEKQEFLHPSLPDTTLRGRIVTNRETGSKCVAITTKRSSRKDYILRQYGSGEKESSLYNVIWKVWWKMCEEDEAFIDDCVKEYKALDSENKKSEK